MEAVFQVSLGDVAVLLALVIQAVYIGHRVGKLEVKVEHLWRRYEESTRI